jgi:ketosteroid isomerase-like protein
MSLRKLTVLLPALITLSACGSTASAPSAATFNDPKDIAAIEAIESRLMNSKKGEDMRPDLDPDKTWIWDVTDHPRYGADEVVRHIDEVLAMPQFANFKPKLVWMDIEAGPNVAFVNAIQNLQLKDASGKVIFDSDYRVTNTYHKKDGKWLVVGEHLSFPVDLNTGKAAFGKAPLPPKN